MAKDIKSASRADSSSIKTRGDIGTAGIGLAIGYFGDLALAHFFPHLGVPPGAASVYFSSAVVGVKQVVQSVLERSRKTCEFARSEQEKLETTETQAKLILDTLRSCANQAQDPEVSQKLRTGALRFERDRRFHDAGILTNEQWNESVGKAVELILECDCPSPSDREGSA